MKRSGVFSSTILLILVFVSAACDKTSEPTMEALFSHAYLNDNIVQFTNESSGDYYFMIWDFGNGTIEATNDKTKSFEVYYPEAGDVEVSLKITDDDVNTDIEAKTITISEDDLVVSFTAEIDPDSSNYVNLSNTTVGELDSFKWLYRNTEFEGEVNHKAYYPKAGSFEIELQVFKNSYMISSKKTVTIAEDDPDFISEMTLTWSDEFNGATINSANWTFETGAGGWGNAELQNYTNGSNAEIVDGKLIITARKVNENNSVGSYTSTRMVTRGKKEFQYGRIEIRAKLPSGTGIWPAIWMLGQNLSTAGWPACGELDIME